MADPTIITPQKGKQPFTKTGPGTVAYTGSTGDKMGVPAVNNTNDKGLINYPGGQQILTPGASSFFGKIGTFFKNMAAIPGASDAAAQAQAQAKKAEQMLANTTGQNVVDESNPDAVRAAQDAKNSASGGNSNAPAKPSSPQTGSQTGSASGNPPSAPNTGSAGAPPATPPITKNSQIDQNYFMKPGETFQDYMARTSAYRNGQPYTPPTKPGTTDSTTLDTKTQENIASSMASSPPSDINSGGSALTSFMDAMNGGSGSSGLMSILENQISAIQDQANTPPPSLVDTYNNLLQTSGIQADQASLLNLDTIMNGTVQDIRTEIQAHGGFATESQIQAMASQRNFWLQQQANLLQNGISMKQQYLNTYMNLTGEDIKNAQFQWQKSFSLEDQLFNTIARMQATDLMNYYRFQNSQMAKLKFSVDSGALANASPETLAAYSMTTGIDMNTLQEASKNASAKTQLSLLLQQSLLNERSGGGTPTTMADQIRNQKIGDMLTSNTGTDGYVSADTYTSALREFNGSGGTAANFINQFPPSQYLTRQELDNLPSDIPQFRTAQFQADLQDGIGVVSTGGMDATQAQNMLTSKYPEEASKIKAAFANLQ